MKKKSLEVFWDSKTDTILLHISEHSAEDWVWEYNQTDCLDYIGLGNEYSLDELSRTDFDILKSIWLNDGGSKDSNYQHFAKYFKDK